MRIKVLLVRGAMTAEYSLFRTSISEKCVCSLLPNCEYTSSSTSKFFFSPSYLRLPAGELELLEQRGELFEAMNVAIPARAGRREDEESGLLKQQYLRTTYKRSDLSS
jgi:hypothetical protein